LSLSLVGLEVRGLLRRKAGVAWFGAVVVVAGVAAAWPATSPTTTYAPATVIGFGVFVSGWLCLFGATYLGACVGAEDHEQNTLKEIHLAGRGRTEVLWERLMAVALVSLALPAAALLTAGAVVAGQSLARYTLGGVSASATSAELDLYSAPLLASLLSGLMGFAFASFSRSRLVGFVGWLGLTFAYASIVSTAAYSSLLAALLRYLPCGPLLNALLGRDNYLDRNLGFSSASAAVSLVGTTVIVVVALRVHASKRSLA
jgi:hypothetical protein